MKTDKIILTLALALLGITASGSVFAGGHVRFGVFIGAPIYAPWYYPPPYYYPPAVVTVPVAPPTYVEQAPVQQAPAQPQGYWYYCVASKTYYPYVKECPAGWQRVTPTPAPG